MTNNKNQYKFSEGEVHQFKITGITKIPDTDESFYILENSNGGKHLLKAIHYEHYNLRVNQTIKCRIDKINCSGKIYLEPENPYYKEDIVYDFEVIKVTEQINSVGELEKIVTVKDLSGTEAICSFPIHSKIDPTIKNISCKVIRIKKGKLFLMHSDYEESKKLLKIGKNYQFIVSEIKKLENGNDYYILKDEHKNLYSLKKDMYKHYGLKIGQEVKCMVTKYNTDGHLKIEPEHLHYKVGNTYSFKYLSTITETNPLEREAKVIVVEDILGIATKVRSFNTTIIKNTIPEYLDCKVVGIRKGKAILSIK